MTAGEVYRRVSKWTSFQSLDIGRLTWAFCDILCECPRGDHLRAL
jgi:hypothetical protein